MYIMNLYVCIIILFSVHVGAKHLIEDYCWRDYNGVIPSDAFSAGLDRNGKPIYVGQILFQGKLITGIILSDSKEIYFDWLWKEHSRTKNIKILCSEQPQKFEWIFSCHDKVSALLRSKILLAGGVEEYPTYIGRKFYDNEMTVGKIISTSNNNYELYTTNNGYTKRHNDFQILTYNPDINSTNVCDHKIDIRFGVKT
ncbi:hypothetical protein FQA39_LY11574 [Lamprigera yunnana]|nr:hypothetical protein FQA39_LY11574 [Lamprigera yunnana]